MTPREISPVTKQVLELGPTILFFVIYLWIKDDTFTFNGTEYTGFIVAALVFVPIILVAMGVMWFLTGTLSRIQIFTAFMVIFFGGLTAWFNDERFFKMKTSIVNGFFAVVLGIGLLQGRSYLQWIMGEYLPMQDEGWMKLTRRMTVFFIFMAGLNELVWRTMSTDAWVKIETFAFPVIFAAYFMYQTVNLQKFLIEPEGGDQTPH